MTTNKYSVYQHVLKFNLVLSLSAVGLYQSVSAHDIGGQDSVDHGHDHQQVLVQARPERARIKKPGIKDTVRANIYADNWFILYINGEVAAVDSIPFIPHNVISVDLLPEYPMTIAVMARDNADAKTGMEYNNTKIGDGGFILKFTDGTVTNATWKAKSVSHGPIDSDTANPKVRNEVIPKNWFVVDFDDSKWPAAKEFTEEEIDPKEPFYENDFKGAKWIWSDSLKLDNTVLFRTVIATPPNGAAVVPDWPRGHIVPSETTATPPEAGESESEKRVLTKDSIEVAPIQAAAFAPFSDDLIIEWDDQFAYIGTNSYPNHAMMTGVTAWNQQVPLPQKYFGDNAWRLPLAPKLSDNPVSGKSSLFKGAIAVAVNGVPIFNPIKQDGRTDTNLAGELDKFGGHAGRGDDYHYHLPPTFLNKLVGDQRPIGFGMDGFPLYGFNEADGTPAKNLDAYNGHDHDGIGYHYHSTTTYPYLNGGLRGVVAMKDGEVALQPRDQAVREFTRPLRGATITEFEKLDGLGYSLTYKLDGEDYVIKVSPQEDGSAKFVFIDPDGTKNEQLYKPMTRPERGPDRGEEGPPKERDRD